MSVVHFGRFRRYRRPACHLFASGDLSWPLTARPELVTCGNCRRTWAWVNAARRLLVRSR